MTDAKTDKGTSKDVVRNPGDPLSAPVPAAKLALDTGALTAEQVNILLTHLPVDISYVDENDTVVYYSATPERIFPRAPGVIGRKVQNCHPSKSVDVVDRILKDFRSGARDHAEFWIQAQGKFIHIRYFALKDAGGAYRGVSRGQPGRDGDQGASRRETPPRREPRERRERLTSSEGRWCP